MELNKAIERLKNTDIYNLGHNDRFEELRLYENAIDTVLEELNNRIPREYVENILKELNEGRYILNENGEITGRRYEYIAIQRLQKLLNKE